MDNLAHRLAIAEQLERYCLAFDSHDADGWAALFTDDGVFEVRLTGNLQPIFQARGAEQLRAFSANAPRLLHHITGLVFDEILPDSARTRPPCWVRGPHLKMATLQFIRMAPMSSAGLLSLARGGLPTSSS